MDIIPSLFNWVFSILNLTITIPINFEQTKFISFPLYLPFLISAVIDLIIIFWIGVVINRNSLE